MRDPEVTTVTLQRIHWPLTEPDLRALVIAALGDRIGSFAAEEAARSDGVFHWLVEDGRVVGAEIGLTIESPVAPPVTLVEAEPVEAPSFRSARAEAPEAAPAQAVLADAEVGQEAPEVTIDPRLRALIEGSHLPSGWSRRDDYEMFGLACDGDGTDDVAVYFGRPPVFIQNRFNQLTGKKSGGPVFTRPLCATLWRFCLT